MKIYNVAGVETGGVCKFEYETFVVSVSTIFKPHCVEVSRIGDEDEGEFQQFDNMYDALEHIHAEMSF
jgi:hypothetical protein